MYTTWVEVDAQALTNNLNSYRAITQAKIFAPVIKSNAYGHGLELVAKICDAQPAVDMLCVISITEALSLRVAQIKKPLLVLGIYDAPLQKAIEQDIQLLVYDSATVQELNTLAQQIGKKAIIHIKVDTGLSRLGAIAEEAISFIRTVHALPHIIIQGICTHMAEAESDSPAYTQYQMSRLNQLLEQLTACNIIIPLIHASASAAVTAYSQTHGTMVRVGIGMYGLWPSPENQCITQEKFPNFTLEPVLTWKTKIIHIKEIPAQTYVGYDRTYQTKSNRRIATLPVGYWDGYDRQLSNTGQVLLYGQLAPIIGRVAMNLMMIDITDIPEALIGDAVTLLGNHPGVSAENLAHLCNTINYETVTRINPLLPRTLK